MKVDSRREEPGKGIAFKAPSLHYRAQDWQQLITQPREAKFLEVSTRPCGAQCYYSTTVHGVQSVAPVLRRDHITSDKRVPLQRHRSSPTPPTFLRRRSTKCSPKVPDWETHSPHRIFEIYLISGAESSSCLGHACASSWG